MSLGTSHRPFSTLPANPASANRGAAAGTGAGAPTVPAQAVTARPSSPTTVITKFNGMDDVTQNRLNGFQLTPPDQGLCSGQDPTLSGDPSVVWEPVNEVAAEYSLTGALLRPAESLATLFHNSNDYGDVRCLYDAAKKTFYFTELDSGGTINARTHVDVAVLNAHGWATYVFSTSMGTHCLGDQPKVGYDANAVVISTDEYCTLSTVPNYPGAIVIVISKTQLVNEAKTVNFWTSTPVSDAGYPVVGLDPAIGAPGGKEFLVNSVPYLTNIHTTKNPVGHKLGEVTVTNTLSVTKATGVPVLKASAMTSEAYTFPIRAKSTGTGAATIVTGTPVYSVASLNPDDSRMSAPVVVTKTLTSKHTMIWTAICVALVPAGTTVTRDGVAWFEIDATKHVVHTQGYVGAKGAYLIYPSIVAEQTAPSLPISFTLTSGTVNPSAAFTTVGSPTVTIVANGAGPQMTYDSTQGFRWGDYSFAAPAASGIWFANEYIPPKADQASFSNWGTEVFEVKP